MVVLVLGRNCTARANPSSGRLPDPRVPGSRVLLELPAVGYLAVGGEVACSKASE
jgi:hypothetical protein